MLRSNVWKKLWLRLEPVIYGPMDILSAGALTALLWGAPALGLEIFWTVQPEFLANMLSRWLAATLTLMGLIIATTGFVSSILEKPEFAPLAKSSSKAQLWEILRQAMGWLLIASAFCLFGSFEQSNSVLASLLPIVGTFVAAAVGISLSKLVWVMRSILGVLISKS